MKKRIDSPSDSHSNGLTPADGSLLAVPTKSKHLCAVCVALMCGIFGGVVNSVVGAENRSGRSQSALRHEVVHGWPVLPEGMLLGQVSGVDLDSKGNVFVFRRAEAFWYSTTPTNPPPIKRPAVLLFDAKTGKQLAAWGENFFITPHGLTVDHEDNVWLTDVGRHQVFKFSHDGKPLLALGEKGVPRDDRSHFNKPTDVAVAPDGSFYVSDGYGNTRVIKFSRDGKFLLQWGSPGDKPGEFKVPHGIAIDPDGRIYVADRGNARVQVFDGSGKFLAEWKGPHLGRPWAVAQGRDGFMWVVDGGDQPGSPPAAAPDRARVHKLDHHGKILATFGSFGNYDGQFVWPHDITVARDGTVYVVDVSIGMRVQKFVTR
jgi:peptidylamidoglycolate lyase